MNVLAFRLCRDFFCNKTKKIVKDDEKCLFNYFTYVSIYDTDKDVYEYACIDFEKFEITYIYLGYLSLDYVMINYDFLPKKYLEDNQFLNEYNLFYCEKATLKNQHLKYLQKNCMLLLFYKMVPL